MPLLFLLLLSACLFPVQAQTGATISGQVQDPSQAAIPAAKITLSRANGDQVRTTETDSQGQFQFAGVAPGAYRVKVQFNSFDLYDQPVRVAANRTPAPITVTLNLEAMRQQLTVQADSPEISTDTADNRNAQTLSGDQLSNLPVFDQDYIGTMSRFLDQGAVATGGVTLVVDGVEANGPGVSPSAIQEVKINGDPYSAEFSRPGRGRIEITTKSGTPQFHGTFNFLYRDQHLNARDPFALVRPPEQRRIYEGSLTGPLGHSKKNSFLISIDRQEQDLQAVVFAQGTSGFLQQNVANPQRRLFASGRINHAFSDTHTFWIGYSYEDRTVQNQGVGGVVLPSAGTNNSLREDEITMNDRAVLTPHLSSNLRLLVGRYDNITNSLSNDPRVVVADAFTGGGGQSDILRTERHWDGTELLTYSRGRHLVKFGVDVPDWSRRGFSDRSNFGGTYFYSSLADYLQQRPYSYTIQRGNGHLVFLEKVLAGFVQDQVQLRPNLTVSLGVRYYWQNYFGDDSNNFAPRAAFAWSPGKTRRTVVRGGAGFFYDRTGPLPIADTLRYTATGLQRYVVTDPFAIGSIAPSIVQLDPRLRIPYTVQYSLGLERQIGKAATVAATYIGTVGVSLFRSRDVNQPLFSDLRPSPAYSQIRQIESAGRQVSNALELSLRGRFSKRFTGTAQYTLSKTLNNTSGVAYFPADAYSLSSEWGRADFDQRHRFNLLGAFDGGRWLHLGAALSLASGAPVNETTGRDANLDGLANDRPVGVSRNSLAGPGYAALDLRWSRDFNLRPLKKDKGPVTTIALDAFNVTNHVNYVTYVGTLSSPFFGRPIVSLPARRLQIGVRFQF